MTIFVYVAASLDGFIATSDGGLDWLDKIPNPDQSDFGYAEFISRIDAIVMGRATFEKVLSLGAWSYRKPVFVLSSSMSNLPGDLAGKVEIVNADLESVVTRLREKGYSNLYVDGGKVIQSFLEEDLVDELIITRVPIVLGAGVPLFGKLATAQKFTHTRTAILNDTLVQSFYTRAR
jgi:dihydrofolate reductase